MPHVLVIHAVRAARREDLHDGIGSRNPHTEQRQTVAVTPPIQAIALTGTIGSGKTTIAEAISEILHDRRIRHALIDLDWLGQVYPVPETHDVYGYELALQNLSDIWPNFMAAGVTHAVIAGTILNSDHVSRLQLVLPGVELTVVLIEARTEIRKARIRARTKGALLNDFLRRTDAVAAEIKAASIHDTSMTNDHDSPGEAATKLLDDLHWR